MRLLSAAHYGQADKGAVKKLCFLVKVLNPACASLALNGELPLTGLLCAYSHKILAWTEGRDKSIRRPLTLFSPSQRPLYIKAEN